MICSDHRRRSRRAWHRRISSLIALSSIAFAAALVTSCHEHEDGAQLSVDAAVVAPSGSPMQWATDLGYVVRIDRAAITVGAIEIVPCEGATASFTSPARWLDDARSWSLVRTAHAHTESSAVRIGTPHVLDLTAPSGALRLGTLEPPLGSYCGLNVDLAPADADAEGLPAETDMVGWTLAVEGSIEEPGGAVIALAARDAGARPIPLSFEPAMAVDADARLTILLEIQVAASFDGIDFASIDDEEQGAAILSRLRVVAHAAP